ncbi:hypothetical protein E4U55_003784 [Claviceps digitariae]|nr:hypothetical protein E4U55_003784 [Claviceps digitariae]
MARLNDSRRQLPFTPSLKLSREQLHIDPATGTNGPTSPPASPCTPSQMAGKSLQTGPFYRFTQLLAQDSNIRPVGNGHQFSYQRTVLGLEQLSPRSSSSSDADEDSDNESPAAKSVLPRSIADLSMADFSDDEGDADEEDGGSNEMSDADDEDVENDGHEIMDEEDYDDGPSLGLAPEVSSQPISVAGSDVEGVTYRSRLHVAMSSSNSLDDDFVVEEIDPMDSEYDGLEILHPTEIESNRSRSRSPPKEVDAGMMQDFKNLHCSNETFDDEVPGLDAELVFRQRQKEIRRGRRASMSSIGKRTHSELGSESGESEAGGMDVNEVGSSARRMRKRLHRGSLLFQDPPAPRIDELEEPDSDAEEYDAADPLARELPFFTVEMME